MVEESLKEFIIDGSNNSVQDILSKLKFLSKVKPQDWVDVTNLQLYERNNWNRPYRSMVTRNESRHTTLEFIRTVFGEAFDLATKYTLSTTPFRQAVAQMIIDATKEARAGIENLKITYEADKMFVSRLESLIAVFDVKINALKAKHPSTSPLPTITAPSSTSSSSITASATSKRLLAMTDDD